MTPQDLRSIADELEEVGREVVKSRRSDGRELVVLANFAWDQGLGAAIAYLRGKADGMGTD